MAVFMRAGFWVAVFLAVGHSFAQTDVKSFERSLKGKQLALRNYSADEVARYDWQDGKLTAQMPLVRTLAIFETGSVKRKGDAILLDGYRFTLMRKDGRLVGSAEVPMTLQVDLHGADAATVLPAFATGLFFDSVGAAVAGVPAQYQSCVPWKMSQRLASDKEPPLAHSPQPNPIQSWIKRDGVWVGISADDPRFQSPQLKVRGEPRYPAEAFWNGIHGSVGMCLAVNESGRFADLWLAAPAKAILNDLALDALSRYVFDPALFDRKPVSTSAIFELSY